MARGGRRAGAPGRSYSNRTDLNQVRQPAVGSVMRPPPVQAPGPASARPTQPMGAPAGPGPTIQPGQLGTFNPTARPNEPLTAGLSTGPGPGPLPSFTPDPMVQAAAQLSSIPAVHRTPAINALLAASNASVANGNNIAVAQ